MLLNSSIETVGLVRDWFLLGDSKFNLQYFDCAMGLFLSAFLSAAPVIKTRGRHMFIRPGTAITFDHWCEPGTTGLAESSIEDTVGCIPCFLARIQTETYADLAEQR